MVNMYNGIICLLKSAITGQSCKLPEDFDLEQAMSLIKKHNIQTLVYEGAVQCGISKQDPVMRQLFSAYCRLLMVSEAQMREISRISDEFNREKIDYMPLKGCRMKSLYPRPELRLMGDADILIRVNQYDRIKPLMLSMGFEEKQDTDHELVWRSDSLYLELHKHLIPSFNKDFYAYYGDGWQLGKYCNGSCYSMRTEDEWIYLFTHFAKHYRDGGIGCRHVLDLWVWRRTYPNMDEAYIDAILKELHLDVFYKHILRLLRMWFEEGDSDNILSILTESIFSSGSFGKDKMRTLSRVIRDKKHSILGFNGRLLYLWQTAFPGVPVLREKYTVLKRFPWMLPIVWAVRPIYKVVCETKTLSHRQAHLKAVSKENMEQRERFLDAIGLGFHF